MKQIKKFFAAVLLGAMVLTMLTGCQSDAAKTKNVFDALQAALGENQKITIDDTLQKKADTFTATFLKGENLESNASAGRAYSKVKFASRDKDGKRADLSDDEAAFWDILTKNDKDVACIVPVWYKESTSSTVNIGLLLPYKKDKVTLSQMLYQTGVVPNIVAGKYTKVGISVVNVKGDDYVVILAGN